MAENTPDYKSTIKLPQTEFPMKGNLPTLEPQIIKKWEENKIYQKMVAKNKGPGKKQFVMPDGPPYANAALHIGHQLNKTLKDIIIKYKNMSGFSAPFIPGWDCHGLPIEHAVLKDLGSKASGKTNQEIRTLCREHAQKWVNFQREQFRRMGVLADWENPYLTMDSDYEAEEVREFARAYKNGNIYLGTKPVYWNWTLQTALADAEVEYHQHKSPAIYVKFTVEDVDTLKRLGPAASTKKTSFVIWTTTPWTLPANLGICLNADFDYGIFDTGSDNIILAKGLKESFEKETGLTLTEKSQFKGKDLERGNARHPFIDRNSLIVLGDHVTMEAGTGCVHTAPGHGADDYKVGIKYGLGILSPVGPNGTFTAEVPEFQGQNIFKANPLIIEKLRASGHLLGFKEIEHSYPHCWRSKTPLIFRATAQWFIGLDLESTQIRKKTLNAIDEKIQFFPQWGQARLRAMMENRPDWCLSRQRNWGVPIPIFYCKKTGHPLADFDVMMKVADLMENGGGLEAYHKINPMDLIGDFKKLSFYQASEFSRELKNDPLYGSEGFVQGNDILDVWFDSGVCHAAIQKRREGMSYPADIYLEGSDQHRGWFNTSLLSAMATNGTPPYKALLTHGFVTDSQGFKMSKSKGNVIDPMDVAKQNGIEILRLWSVYEDYGQDLSCGKTELERVTETYRRIRNTMRFLLGATSDFDPTTNSIPHEKMTEIDQWALARLYELNKKITAAFEEYSFYKVYHALNTFFTVDLSATYLDILKDRLYTWKVDGVERRGSQTVLYHMTDYLVRMMAPILSFLAEESYGYMKTGGAKVESVFLLDFPVAPEQWNNPALLEKFQNLLVVRSEVQKQLEVLRANKTIGASLEGLVTITADGETLKSLQSFFGASSSSQSGLREFLIVSKVELKSGTFSVTAQKAPGEKCVRCWTYYDRSTEKPDGHSAEKLNVESKFPGICQKCIEALS
jgi:isoleucyl-tRNA synthetase